MEDDGFSVMIDRQTEMLVQLFLAKIPQIALFYFSWKGMNYSDHCHEQNIAIPEEPVVFNKFASALSGPNVCLFLMKTKLKKLLEVYLAVMLLIFFLCVVDIGIFAFPLPSDPCRL